MDIALINFARNIRTLGALNISSFLRANGYPNSLVYWPLPHGTKTLSDRSMNGLVSALEPLKPRVIGISLTSVYFYVARLLTAHLKAAFPSAMVVWGGVHPTLSPDECLACCDGVFIGEGEESTLEFLRKLDRGENYSDTAGLFVRVGEKVYKNEVGPLCQELDSRPFPSLDWENCSVVLGGQVLPLSKELFVQHSDLSRHMYDIMASRGCPLSCTYCCNSAFKKIYHGKGSMLRFRSVDHVVSELEHVTREFPQVRMFNFQDDAFGAAPREYLRRFCGLYKSKIGRPFHIRIIPHMIDEERIRLLKDAGLVSAVMGLQSSDKLNREIYKRPTTREQFIGVARMLHRNGITGRYDTIVNNPYGTEEDEIEVINTFLEIPKPYMLYIYPLAFFPFTELTEKATRDGKYQAANAGYDHAYGSTATLRFPGLFRLLHITPYSPKFLIKFFLWILPNPAGRALFSLYWNLVGRGQLGLISFIRASFSRMMVVKKVVRRLVAP